MDSFYKYKYDNVTVIIQTGHFNEEVNNAKIIGQYASLLCEKSEYQEQVFLFFGHDYYPDDLNNITIAMSYQSNYIYEILGFSPDYINDYDSILMNNERKIVIQQFGFHFHIKETIELVNFAIENTEVLKRKLESRSISGKEIKSINKTKIDSIRRADSKVVNSILETKVDIKPLDYPPKNAHYEVTYFSQNGKYIIIDFEETIIDTLDQVLIIECINDLPTQYIVVLESKESLLIFSRGVLDISNYTRSQDFNPKFDNTRENLSEMILTPLKFDVLLIEFADLYQMKNDTKLIYLLQEDVLITNLMDFINENKTKN